MIKLYSRSKAYRNIVKKVKKAGLTPEEIMVSEIGTGVMDEEKRKIALCFIAAEKVLGYDLDAEYRRIRNLSCLCRRWQDPKQFVSDILKTDHSGLTEDMRIFRVSKKAPLDENNYVFKKAEEKEKSGKKRSRKAAAYVRPSIMYRKCKVTNDIIAEIERLDLSPQEICESKIGAGLMDEEERHMLLLFASVNKMYGYDFSRVYRRIELSKDICERWLDPIEFLADIITMDPEGLSPEMGMYRISNKEPICPENCYFGVKNYRTEKRIYFTKEIADIEQNVLKAEELLGTDFAERWYANVQRGVFDPEVLSLSEFKRSISDLYVKGFIEKGMYLNKIRPDKPFTRFNMKFSYRRRGRFKHGLTETTLWQRRGYYNSVASEKIGMEEFATISVYEKDYLPNRHMKITRNGINVTLADVCYMDLNDGFHQEEMNALRAAWNSIPRDRSAFASEKDFYAWSILSGYRKGKTFRCFDEESYSADTCAWDFYTYMSVLESLLDDRGMSVREFERRMEIPYGTAGFWSRGSIKIPKRYLEKAASILNVSVEDLAA